MFCLLFEFLERLYLAKIHIHHIQYIQYLFWGEFYLSDFSVFVEICVFLEMVYMSFASSLFSQIFKILSRSSFLITFLSLLHFLKYCIWTVFIYTIFFIYTISKNSVYGFCPFDDSVILRFWKRLSIACVLLAFRVSWKAIFVENPQTPNTVYTVFVLGGILLIRL